MKIPHRNMKIAYASQREVDTNFKAFCLPRKFSLEGPASLETSFINYIDTDNWSSFELATSAWL